jgi:hypothetical protein
VDVATICLDVCRLLEAAHRRQLRNAAGALAEALRDVAGKNHFSFPELELLTTNQQDLFERLGGTHDLRYLLQLHPRRRDAVLEGYVLDTLRVRELLVPLLALPWRRLRCALAGAPFEDATSVAGLASWARELLERAHG